jgi:hypothetical protein
MLPNREPGKVYRNAAALDETQEFSLADLAEYDRRCAEDDTVLLDEGAARAYIDKVVRRT